jgi:DNA polymerase III delta prime subunit
MALQIKKAVKYGSKMRLALYGPSGSGKTYSALKIAHAMAGDKRVCLIDTERGSASKYADVFPDFDVIELDSFNPNNFVEAIRLVVKSKDYSVLIIDSISHEWEGKGGALELAGHNFANWAKVTPLHNAFVDEMLRAPIHLIATMRAKEEYSMDKEDGKDGKSTKSVVTKKGMEPIQRKGVQYEFDIIGSLDMDNSMTIEKTRCSSLQGLVFPYADQDFVEITQSWLDGELPPVRMVSGDKLNELYNRGIRARLFAKGPEEFADYIKEVLDLDAPIEPRMLTEEQGQDLEAMIYNREQQANKAS